MYITYSGFVALFLMENMQLDWDFSLKKVCGTHYTLDIVYQNKLYRHRNCWEYRIYAALLSSTKFTYCMLHIYQLLIDFWVLSMK